MATSPVQEKTTHIHVGRSDDCQVVVDQDDLGMNHPRLVEQDLPSRVLDLAQVADPGPGRP